MISDERLRLMQVVDTLREAYEHDFQFGKLLFIAESVYNDESYGDPAVTFARIALSDMIASQLNLNKDMSHVSYAPLAGTLAKYSLTITSLCDAIGVSAGVRSNLVNNRPVNIHVLNRIAMLLNCGLDDIVEFISESEARSRLRFGKMVKSVPSIFELGLDSQYNPKYTDEETLDTDVNIYESNYRNFLVSFHDVKSGFEDLMKIFDLKKEDYNAWAGLADEL